MFNGNMQSNAQLEETQPELTTLEKNAFAVIGATTRDDKKRIVELAEEKSFTGDHELCSKARADLTTPRSRLSAEIGWLPGVSPKRATELLKTLKEEPAALRAGKTKIAPIARANLLAACLESLDESVETAIWIEWVLDFAQTADKIIPETVLRDINEDRTISGFPEIKGVEAIQGELAERKRVYKDAVKSALDNLPAAKLLEVVTGAVEQATEMGEKHAPALIDDMVDSYELHTQEFLRREADKVIAAVNEAADVIASNKNGVKAAIAKVEKLARHWDKFAHPIQLSMKSRGLWHDMSREVGYDIRALVLKLAHEDMLDIATQVTKFLKEIFAELPELAEQTDKDSSELSEMIERNAAEAAEITYEATLGTIFKNKLALSPAGIEWKGNLYPLDSIKEVSWGGTAHSTNGIPTGTTYEIHFSDGNRTTTINPRNGTVYQAFTNKLWKAVCVFIMINILRDLKDGKKIRFGNTVVDDEGIMLTRHKMFGSEQVYVKWGDVRIYTQSGHFGIRLDGDTKVYSTIPFATTPNCHILHHIVETAFKKWRGRLSGLLES
jgi:hypothetical protein